MQFFNKKLLKISYWKILIVSLGSQIIANLFFGLPLLLIIFINYPAEEVKKLAYIYLIIYLFFTFFYTVLPYFLLVRINRFLKKYSFKKETENKEIVKTLRRVLNFPINIAFWIFVTCFSAFATGVITAKWFSFFETYIDKSKIITVIGVGFVVSLAFSWLSYALFERGFQSLVSFLVKLCPQANPEDLKIRKIPIFYKLLALGTSGIIMGQISLFLLFYQEATAYLPPLVIERFFTISLANIMLVFSFFFLISLIAVHNISHSFKRFAGWSKKIARGNLEEIIDIRTTDEISELAFSLNQMRYNLLKAHEQLKESKETLEIKVNARTRELREMTDSLENQVQQRTKQMEEKVKELEKFQKLIVGRELKMIELKKEISKIKQQLKKGQRKNKF